MELHIASPMSHAIAVCALLLTLGCGDSTSSNDAGADADADADTDADTDADSDTDSDTGDGGTDLELDDVFESSFELHVRWAWDISDYTGNGWPEDDQFYPIDDGPVHLVEFGADDVALTLEGTDTPLAGELENTSNDVLLYHLPEYGPVAGGALRVWIGDPGLIAELDQHGSGFFVVDSVRGTLEPI